MRGSKSKQDIIFRDENILCVFCINTVINDDYINQIEI
jgi:hypothetical protein